MNPVVKFTDFLYSYYLFQEGIQNETDFHLLSLWFNVVKKLENESFICNLFCFDSKTNSFPDSNDNNVRVPS